jgi:hypothetical protein
MHRYPPEKTSQLLEEPRETITPRSSLLHRSLARCHAWQRERRDRANAWQRERRRHATHQRLASRVEEILIGCRLTQFSYSIGGGRSMRVPQVVSVDAGPPVRVDILTLPGQMPDHFAVKAPTIAYNLGVTEVRVVPLGPSQIRLELLQECG